MQTGRKGRKMIRILGVTAAVYGVFRYLLPLVAPFLLAWITAMALKPSACFLAGKLKVTWRGRTFGIGPGVIGVAELLVLIAGAGLFLYWGSRKLYQEAAMLVSRFPQWVRQFDTRLTRACHKMEQFFSLKDDVMVHLIQDMIRNLGNTIKQSVMPYLMGNSVQAAKCCVGLGILAVLYTIAVMLFIQELDTWKEKAHDSLFRDEFMRIGNLLKIVGKAYLRTQGLIMTLTMAICTAGFFLLGSPYYILAGIGIGLLDALPVFGTGTVLIPWAVIECVKREWGRGVGILALYVICYFVREVLEAKLMGDKVGLSPLETLISIYGGLKLFGVLGVVLGPVGVLVVKEFAGERAGKRKNENEKENITKNNFI